MTNGLQWRRKHVLSLPTSAQFSHLLRLDRLEFVPFIFLVLAPVWIVQDLLDSKIGYAIAVGLPLWVVSGLTANAILLHKPRYDATDGPRRDDAASPSKTM